MFQGRGELSIPMGEAHSLRLDIYTGWGDGQGAAQDAIEWATGSGA